MNILIPFRNTGSQEELKMAIELILSNYKVPFKYIYIVGDTIDFDNENVKNIIIEEKIYNKWLDCNFLIEKYINNVCSDQPFLLFNDDFFITDIVCQYKTNFYCGTLQERLEKTYVLDYKMKVVRISDYGLNIKSCIAKNGNIINGELHLPMYIDKPTLMLDVIKQCNSENYPAMRRSVYLLKRGKNNIQEVTSDVKFSEPHFTLKKPYFSLTNDQFEFFKDELKASIKKDNKEKINNI